METNITLLTFTLQAMADMWKLPQVTKSLLKFSLKARILELTLIIGNVQNNVCNWF